MLQIKNFLCCVVKEKFHHSFVLPKKYSIREINNFPKRYKYFSLLFNILDTILSSLSLVSAILFFDVKMQLIQLVMLIFTKHC